MKKLSIMVLAFALTACGEPPKDTASTSAKSETPVTASATTTTAEKSAQVMTVDAKTLFKDYKENEVKADGKYKGKNLLVTGTVDSIESGIGDEANLMLKTGNDFEFVNATMDDSQKAKAGEIKKGAKVKLNCVSDGEIMGSPMLKDCKFA